MGQFNLSSIRVKAVLLLGAALIFFSCNNGEKTGVLGKINRNFANRTIFNANVVYKDSGKVVLFLKTPLIKEYSFIDSPYTVMPKGLTLKFWGKDNPNPNFLRADWAKINDSKKTYEGRGNVVMINNEGDTLKTQKIFWDRYARKIFTKDTVEISRLNGTKIISNNGLEGVEDFKEFTFFQNHGVINAEEKAKRKSGDSVNYISNKIQAFPQRDKKAISLPNKEKVSR